MYDLKQMSQKVKKFSVLVVDDDEKIREGVSSFMMKFFKKVDMAKNGKEALKLLVKNRYEILITDMYMPQMSGEVLIQKAKELNSDIFISIISGSQDNFNDSLLFNIFLEKPITFENLKRLLHIFIQKKNL